MDEGRLAALEEGECYICKKDNSDGKEGEDYFLYNGAVICNHHEGANLLLKDRPEVRDDQED